MHRDLQADIGGSIRWRCCARRLLLGSFIMVAMPCLAQEHNVSPSSNTDEISTAHDPSQQQEGDIVRAPVLTQANKWSWNLEPYYKGIGSAFLIGGQVMILLSKNACCRWNGSLLWDPMSGRSEFVSDRDRFQFERSHKLVDSNGFSGPIRLNDDGSIVLTSTSSFCDPPVDHYYSAFDRLGHLIRAFLIVRELTSPKTMVGACADDANPDGYTYKQNILTPNVRLASLPDGTVLVWEFDGGYLLRLDRQMRAHSTFPPRLFVIDAAPIIPDLSQVYDPVQMLEIANRDLKSIEASYPQHVEQNK